VALEGLLRALAQTGGFDQLLAREEPAPAADASAASVRRSQDSRFLSGDSISAGSPHAAAQRQSMHKRRQR
jgi:hypothetical protein